MSPLDDEGTSGEHEGPEYVRTPTYFMTLMIGQLSSTPAARSVI